MGVTVLEGTGTMPTISSHLCVQVKCVVWTGSAMKTGVL